MSTGTTLQISSDGLENTERIAASLGERVRGGEVIVLTSDLGGGKTAFVRGMAKGMGSTDHVASPTFTIGREYHSADQKLTLFHFDFYRLNEPGIVALELQEALQDPAAVIAIEWGEIVQDVLPDQKMLIKITRTGEYTRDFSIEYPAGLAYLMPKEQII